LPMIPGPTIAPDAGSHTWEPGSVASVAWSWPRPCLRLSCPSMRLRCAIEPRCKPAFTPRPGKPGRLRFLGGPVFGPFLPMPRPSVRSTRSAGGGPHAARRSSLAAWISCQGSRTCLQPMARRTLPGLKRSRGLPAPRDGPAMPPLIPKPLRKELQGAPRELGPRKPLPLRLRGSGR